MSVIPVGTALGYHNNYSVNKTEAINLFGYEGFKEIQPVNIEIIIKPVDTITLHTGVPHKINNRFISRINADDFEWFTVGLRVYSIADKNIGQIIQIRINPTDLIFAGIEVKIKPSYWCPNGAKYLIPR